MTIIRGSQTLKQTADYSPLSEKTYMLGWYFFLDNKEIIQTNNLSNIKDNLLKINNLNDLSKKESKENFENSKSLFSSNLLDINNYKFISDFQDKDKKEAEIKLKTKKSKKKSKKVLVKKKNTNKNINNNINELNQNESFKNKEKLSENFKNNVNLIIKIQSAWRFYKSKIKLKLFRFIKSLVNAFKNKKIDYFKYLFIKLKEYKDGKMNNNSIGNKKLNELLQKGKNYDILNNKYEKVLKELNEIKNKLTYKQNLNMINNKNQNISINIFPTKVNKRKNNLIMEKTNKILISNEKNAIDNKTIYNSCNLFYLLEKINQINLRYYFLKFILFLSYIKNSKIKKKNNENNFIISKIKSFSIKKKLKKKKNKINVIKAKYQNNLILSSQISWFIKPVKHYKINDLNIQEQCSIELKYFKNYDLQISEINEITFERKKIEKKVINKDNNYIINKIKNFWIYKDEYFIENHIINYLKKKKYILEKIKKIFNLKLEYFNEKILRINKIFEIEYNKRNTSINSIYKQNSCKKNYFFEINKLVINKIINNFKIIKIKGKTLIINKLSSNNVSIVKRKNLKNNIIMPKKEKILYISGNTKIKEELISEKIIPNDENIKNNNENKIYIKDKLVITRTGSEFFMRIKRKRRLKKKKSKRFKTKNLFISDYNQLYIKRNKSNNNIIIKENINNDNNIEKL